MESEFVLSSIRSEGQFNYIIYEDSDSYRGTSSRWSVLMNEKDMEQMSLKKGSKVNLHSSQGGMQSVEVHPFDLPRGNVLSYYPETNVLTSNAVDAVSTPRIQIRNALSL